jgi:hypothetical protein
MIARVALPGLGVLRHAQKRALSSAAAALLMATRPVADAETVPLSTGR